MKYALYIPLMLIFLIGCSEDYIPDTKESNQQYVVEGFIEAGDTEMPAYVLLTKSIPFLSTIDLNTSNELFVNDALVTVNDGDKDVVLSELCLNELPPEIRNIAAQILGFDPDSLDLNICAYIDFEDQLTRAEGRSYDLSIVIENEPIITATTTIPEFAGISDLRFEKPAGNPPDSLAQLFITINDPGDIPNYYRYFTAENDDGYTIPLASVTNDNFFDGLNFEFQLSKAEDGRDGFDPVTFGLFTRGDSIKVKWMNLDEHHFNFWTTLEFNRNSAGPFSSYTRVSSNVNGALGVWGGYSVGVYESFVPFN